MSAAPDRELDALVAEKVMSENVLRQPAFVATNAEGEAIEVPAVYSLSGGPLPAYSRDIDAAWQVVEMLRSENWRVSLSEINQFDWNCRFTPEDTSAYIYALAPSPALTICLAALLVRGVEVAL